MLFPPQRQILEQGFLTAHRHCLVHMPTGSGKTYLAELAMQKVIAAGHKAIYVTPLRALAAEKAKAWGEQYPAVNIGVFTGETAQKSASGTAYRRAQLLIMTPERLDACLRNWKKHWPWIPEVSLLVIDEFHILSHPSRGPRLEGCITRFLRLNPFVRIMALSATMPNTQELASWLHGDVFSSQWRQIPLEIRTVSFESAKEKPEILWQAVSRCVSEGGQSLVFCNSRSRAQAVAQALNVRGLVAQCHHAGLTGAQRQETEARYRAGKIQVLAATSTLEMGMNLPARQVILYDFYSFSEAGYTPLPVWSFLQRAGRAGRPNLDEKGEAVLLLPRWAGSADRYHQGNCEQVTSQLLSRKAMYEQILIEVFAGYSRTREALARGFLPLTLYRHQHPEASVDTAVGELVSTGLLTETTDPEHGDQTQLQCGLLGKLAVKLMLYPETVSLVMDAYRKTERLFLFDLLLLATLSEDCTPVLQTNYEELDAVCQGCRTRQSGFLALSVEDLRKRLPACPAPARILSGIKMAVICACLTEGEKMEQISERFSACESDIRMLQERTARVLMGISAITGAADLALWGPEAVQEKKKQAGYIPNVSAMLAGMLQYEIDSMSVELTCLKGVGGKTAKALSAAGYRSLEQLRGATAEQLAGIKGIGKKMARSIVAQAKVRCPDMPVTQYREEPCEMIVETETAESTVDPYRLRRSLELTLKGKDGPVHRVSGGREDHTVIVKQRMFVCDCLDFEKNGGDCKHILCVKRTQGDREICRAVKMIQEDKGQTLRQSLPGLWFAMTQGRRYGK